MQAYKCQLETRVVYVTRRYPYRFDGEDCKDVELGIALCSLNVWSLKDDCLLRAAGVGKGSGLMPTESVGSAGRVDPISQDDSLFTRFGACPSPIPLSVHGSFGKLQLSS